MRVNKLHRETKEEFAAVYEEFETVRAKLGKVNERAEGIEGNLGQVNVRVIGLERVLEAHLTQPGGGGAPGQAHPAPIGGDAIQALGDQVKRLATAGEGAHQELKNYMVHVGARLEEIRVSFNFVNNEREKDRRRIGELQDDIGRLKDRNSELYAQVQVEKQHRGMGDRRVDALEMGLIEKKPG